MIAHLEGGDLDGMTLAGLYPKATSIVLAVSGNGSNGSRVRYIRQDGQDGETVVFVPEPANDGPLLGRHVAEEPSDVSQ